MIDLNTVDHIESKLDAEPLIDHMQKLGFSEEKINDILLDSTEYTKALFMSWCWGEYTVISPMPEGWLQRTASATGYDANREKIFEFYDESNDIEINEALSNFVKLGINEKDLYKVIRASQKNVLGYISLMLDGGNGGDFGLFKTEYLNEQVIPKDQIYGIQDDIFEFELEKNK